MKRLLYCALAASILFSCKPKTLLEEYKPIVQGVWVKKDYLEKVIKTKSPAAAEQSFYDITILNIDTRQIKGDSLIVFVGKASHDLSYVKLYFRPGKGKGTVLIGDSEADYQISGKDTILNVHFEMNGKPGIAQYLKVMHNGDKEKIGMGLDHTINKHLFAGKYDLKDSTGVKEVEFTVDGRVKGLGAYKTYYVNNDFIKGMHNVDGLTFDMASKKSSGLAFKILGDTLKLYNTTFDEKTEVTTLTDLKYLLVRKK